MNEAETERRHTAMRKVVETCSQLDDACAELVEASSVDWEEKAKSAYLALVGQGARIEKMKTLLRIFPSVSEVLQKEIDDVIGPPVYVDIYGEELLTYFFEQGIISAEKKTECIDNLRKANSALQQLSLELEEKTS